MLIYIYIREFFTYSHLNLARLLVIAKRAIKLCIQRLNSLFLAGRFSFTLASTHLLSIENYTYFDRTKYRFTDIDNLFGFFFSFIYKRVFSLHFHFFFPFIWSNDYMLSYDLFPYNLFVVF